MKVKSTIIAAIALYGTMSFNHASAAVITFDGLAGTSMPGASNVAPGLYTRFNYYAPATVDGFNISGYPLIMIGTAFANTYTGAYSSYFGDAGDYAWNGTDYVMAQHNGNIEPDFIVSLANGGAFTLNSLDLASWQDGYYYPAEEITITGNFMGGGSISQIVALDFTANATRQAGNDFTTYTLTGFTSLSSVTITKKGTYFLALDNLDYTKAPIPEPETYAMLLAGLGLLGFVGRRRKNSVA